jgi:hypothetical protein
VHTFINDLERPVGTYLYGRGLMVPYISSSSPLILDCWIYCNRTASGLICTGTQWTKRYGQIIENP